MKRPSGLILQILSLICVWPVVAGARSESAGVAQYFNNCASCHESVDATHQAPRKAVRQHQAVRLSRMEWCFIGSGPSPAVRLDVFADERKKKAEETK